MKGGICEEGIFPTTTPAIKQSDKENKIPTHACMITYKTQVYNYIFSKVI